MIPRNRLADRPEEDEPSPAPLPPDGFQMLPLSAPLPPHLAQLYAHALGAAGSQTPPEHSVHTRTQTVHSAIIRLHLEDAGFVEPVPRPEAFMVMPATQMPDAITWLYQQAFLRAQEDAREDERRRSRARIDRLLGN